MTMKTARHIASCSLLALAAIALPDRPLNAWGVSGHRVVARIAWERMTPAVRSRANDLLESAVLTRSSRRRRGLTKSERRGLKRTTGISWTSGSRSTRSAGPRLSADRSRRLRDCGALAPARHR
jgi:hypothetical protein